MDHENAANVADKLREIGKLLSSIADRTEMLASDDCRALSDNVPLVISAGKWLGPRVMVNTLLAVRQCRREMIDDNELSEVSWDILLGMYAELRRSGMAVRTKHAVLCGHCPATTAMRWLDVLVEQGLIRRFESKTDLRVTMVELTEVGIEAVEAYLHSAALVIERALTGTPTCVASTQMDTGQSSSLM